MIQLCQTNSRCATSKYFQIIGSSLILWCWSVVHLFSNGCLSIASIFPSFLSGSYHDFSIMESIIVFLISFPTMHPCIHLFLIPILHLSCRVFQYWVRLARMFTFLLSNLIQFDFCSGFSFACSVFLIDLDISVRHKNGLVLNNSNRKLITQGIIDTRGHLSEVYRILYQLYRYDKIVLDDILALQMLLGSVHPLAELFSNHFPLIRILLDTHDSPISPFIIRKKGALFLLPVTYLGQVYLTTTPSCVVEFCNELYKELRFCLVILRGICCAA